VRAVDIILRKREGEALSPHEIDFFIKGFVDGNVPDYQAAALLMAIHFRGMDAEETAALTQSMLGTGRTLDLGSLPGPKVDKHSTGGVGDKTSLITAPLAAACGVVVPMISGRGLGHTGGTLDKLEAVPGLRVDLSLSEFEDVLQKAHLAFMGPTPAIAPADRRLYALRDVTGTVESCSLIAASIMSKKLAEGIDSLVLDVKSGDGAFMSRLEDARALAGAMVEIGRGMGTRVVALITNMDQPLGWAVGNALEVGECVETLKGRGPKDLESLSVELAAWMLAVAGLADSVDRARVRVRDALDSGAGLRKLQEVIELQGGDPRVCDSREALPRAGDTVEIRAPNDARVAWLGSRQVGQAAMLLGAGRETVDSRVDPAVGLVIHKKVGDLVIEGEPLATLHLNDRRNLEAAERLARDSFVLARKARPPGPLIHEVLTEGPGDSVEPEA
jgi:pyrimidine-nucleoside phosphorylase/thymidine phosphorylase